MPSIMLLLYRPDMPRKLSRPKPPSLVVPGVESAKLSQRRPLIGRFIISLRLTTELTSVLVVSTGVVSPLTVTVSEVAETCIVAFTTAAWPTDTVIPERTRVANPALAIFTSYTPGCSATTSYRPASFDSRVRATLVPELRTSIEAPGMIAPVGSVTRPEMLPVPEAAWPNKADVAARSSTINARRFLQAHERLESGTRPVNNASIDTPPKTFGRLARSSASHSVRKEPSIRSCEYDSRN